MTDHFEIEESFHSKDNKAHKKERKQAQARDRSKYKKTDKSKKETKTPSVEGRRGRVLSTTGGVIVVDIDGQETVCTLKGALKKEKGEQIGLVTVGDFVIVNPDQMILQIEDRYSLLSRKDNLRRRKQQILAANIDQVIITNSVQDPYLKPSLIDRYIISTIKGGMKPLILINKIDLNQCDPLVNEIKSIYSKLDIPVLMTSAETKEGIEELKSAMEGKSSVFSGQSGVGKTSLINLITGKNLKTGEVARTGKGAHTTTMAELVPIGPNSFCIDTPGIKSFSLWDISSSELLDYFHDLQEFSQDCKFVNCTHTHEPGCAVKSAVESGDIPEIRYQSYIAIKENNDADYKDPWS